MTCRKRFLMALLAMLGGFAGGSVRGQNDWQAPDPYFGVFQHREAATPEAERRYRAEIAPQQPRPVTRRKDRSRRGGTTHGFRSVRASGGSR
jgi:hypothetical protein